MTIAFVPTRLNVADDPTRDAGLRSPIGGLELNSWDDKSLQLLAALPPTRRWASNWVRFVLKLLGPRVLSLSDRSLFRQTNIVFQTCAPDFSLKDFDSTLGFPGEGPSGPPDACSHHAPKYWIFNSHNSQPCRLISCNARPLRRRSPFVRVCRCLLLRPYLFLLGCLICGVDTSHFGAMAMPIQARTPGEFRKAAERATRPTLAVTRPVTEATKAAREKRWGFFCEWCNAADIDLQYMLDNSLSCVEEINCVLSRFGRELYNAGKSYNQYAETINSLSSKKPGLRRLLQQSWDLGYSWMRSEPSVHHVAMPVPVILAMTVVCLMWGWVREASSLTMGFCGLLRPGEITSAIRKDLLLPRDVGGTINYALLTIREPKSRYTFARHQSAKIDAADFLKVMDLGFGGLLDSERLWPFSPQTLRQRFKAILQSLTLPTTSLGPLRCLDLGSLRCGGATYIIQCTEDSELTRRRGRWANHKMMEIYVQESMALQYMRYIEPSARKRVLDLAHAFPSVLAKASDLSAAAVPTSAWFSFFAR